MLLHIKSLSPVLCLSHVSFSVLTSNIQLLAAILDCADLYYSHLFIYSSDFSGQLQVFVQVSNQLLKLLNSFPLNYCVKMHVTYAPCIFKYIIYTYPYDWYDPYKWPAIFKINLVIFCCVMILTFGHSSIGHLSNLPFFSVIIITVMNDFF